MGVMEMNYTGILENKKRKNLKLQKELGDKVK
jgi:hypothetical protein